MFGIIPDQSEVKVLFLCNFSRLSFPWHALNVCFHLFNKNKNSHATPTLHINFPWPSTKFPDQINSMTFQISGNPIILTRLLYFYPQTFYHWKVPGSRLTRAYSQTASVGNMSRHIVRVSLICLPIITYPPSTKIYRQHQHMKSSNANQKDYRAVEIFLVTFIPTKCKCTPKCYGYWLMIHSKQWPGSGIREKLATSVVRSRSRCCCNAALLLRCWVASTSSFSIACFMLSTCLLSIAFCSSYSVFCRRSCRNSASRTEHTRRISRKRCTAMLCGDLHWKFREDGSSSSRYMLIDRQTDRRVDHNTPHSYQGWVIIITAFTYH